MSEEKMTMRKYSLIIFIIVVLLSGWLGVFIDSILPEQPDVRIKKDHIANTEFLSKPTVII